MDDNDIRAQADNTCPVVERRDGKLKCPVCGAEGVAGQRIPHKDGCRLGEAIEDAVSKLDQTPKEFSAAMAASLATVPADLRAKADRFMSLIMCTTTDEARNKAVDELVKDVPNFDKRMEALLRKARPNRKQALVLRAALMFEFGIRRQESVLLSRLEQLKGDVTSALK